MANSKHDSSLGRVKFYGIYDFAVHFYAPRVVEIGLSFNPDKPIVTIADALELHNVQLYLKNEIFPHSCTSTERDLLKKIWPKIHSNIAKFFDKIDNSNFEEIVQNIDYEFHDDLLRLLGSGHVFLRCRADIVIPVLKKENVTLRLMLENRALVKMYDEPIRAELLESPEAAECLVDKYLVKDSTQTIHLPNSFTPEDSNSILERYILDRDANFNYLRLISQAKDDDKAGINPILRFKAHERVSNLESEILNSGEKFKIGVDLEFSENLEEPFLSKIDRSEGIIQRITYSKGWLRDTLDFPSVLNNFQHLFEFCDEQVLLNFPAYPSAIGPLERSIGLRGNTEYKTGSSFQLSEYRGYAQTKTYKTFLDSHGIDLENLIAWFYNSYLASEFGVKKFYFHASTPNSTNLEKVRHLFPELESVLKQFSLYVENGEINHEFLQFNPKSVRYENVPSLVEGKYAYTTDNRELSMILDLLFSDQSPLKITTTAKDRIADNAALLLGRGDLNYSDFHDYQKPHLDNLINSGVLMGHGYSLQFVDRAQIMVLNRVFQKEAISYYRLPLSEQKAVDAMVKRGWLVRKSSLLTPAEAGYFNFTLNNVDFNNGPSFRNKYQHGQQGVGDDQNDLVAYMTTLRLLISIIIKINDDFVLASDLQRQSK